MEKQEEKKSSNHVLSNGLIGLGIAGVAAGCVWWSNGQVILDSFFVAIENNDLKQVGMFLDDKKINVNTKNSRGETALIIATKHNTDDIIEKLLDKGADPNIQTRAFHGSNLGPSRSPLRYALKHKNCKIFKMLLEKGADPNIKNQLDSQRWNCYEHLIPLTEAVETGNLYAVEQLIKYGADSNVADVNGCTPLHYIFKASGCSKACAPGMLNILLKSKADPTIANNKGCIPWNYLRFGDHKKHTAITMDIIKLCIRHFPDQQGTIFHCLALSPSFPAICKEFVETQKPRSLQDDKILLLLLMAQKRAGCIISTVPQRLLLYMVGRFLRMSNPQCCCISIASKEMLAEKYNNNEELYWSGTKTRCNNKTVAEVYRLCAMNESEEDRKQLLLNASELLNSNNK